MAEALAEAQRRYGDLSPQEHEAMLDLAVQQHQAAVALNDPANADNADPSLVPVNPALFGDEPDGRRQRSTFHPIGDDGRPGPAVTLDFADVTAPSQQQREAIDRMLEIFHQYPERFPNWAGKTDSEITVIMLDTSRKY